MKCPKCQHELPNYQKVCTICGYQVAATVRKNVAVGCFLGAAFFVLLIFGGVYFAIDSQSPNSTHEQVSISVTKPTDNKDYQDPYLVELIQNIKSRYPLPMELDNVTTWTDVTTEGLFIEYHYILLKSYSENFHANYIRGIVLGNICKNQTIQDLLRKNYYAKYSYTLEGTNRVESFSVIKEDCF